MKESMGGRRATARQELEGRRMISGRRKQFMPGQLMPGAHLDRVVGCRSPFFVKKHGFDGTDVSRELSEWEKNCYVFQYKDMKRYIPKGRLDERVVVGEHPILSITHKGMNELKKGILSLPYRGEKEPSKRALGNIARSIFYYAGKTGVPLWEKTTVSYIPTGPIIRIMTLEGKDTLLTIKVEVYSGGVLVGKKSDSRFLVLVKFEEFETGLVDLERVSMFPDKRGIVNGGA
jgi:hypothetical protein